MGGIPWGIFLFYFECFYAMSMTMAKSFEGLECSISYMEFSFVNIPDQDDID